MITLDNIWKIEPESTSGWKLIKTVQKTKKKTGETYQSEDVWYYPKLQQILNHYVEEACKDCTSIEELNDKLVEIEANIEKVKKIYVVNGKLSTLK